MQARSQHENLQEKTCPGLYEERSRYTLLQASRKPKHLLRQGEPGRTMVFRWGGLLLIYLKLFSGHLFIPICMKQTAWGSLCMVSYCVHTYPSPQSLSTPSSNPAHPINTLHRGYSHKQTVWLRRLIFILTCTNTTDTIIIILPNKKPEYLLHSRPTNVDKSAVVKSVFGFRY